jgi:glycosyltransferase involved in cell wall biosynthesis
MQVAPEVGIASYVVNTGYDVTWILPFEEPCFQEVLFNKIRIFAIPCKYKKGTLNPTRLVLYFAKRINFVLKNFKNEKYDLIFVRDGVIDGVLALYIKKRYHVPMVFQMSNPIEQTWGFSRVYSKIKFIRFFTSKLEAYIFTNILLCESDLVLPISQGLKEDFIKKGIHASKMLPIPEGIDPDRFLNADGKEIRMKYNLSSSAVIIYVGTMHGMRKLDVLIYAFAKVRENRKDVKLVMVGDGNDRLRLQKIVSEQGLNDAVIFTGQVPFDQVPDFIEASDIGVSPVPPFEFYKLSSPTKMFEYMAARKPVVCNEEILEHKKVIEESNGGLLVKFEVDSFADGLLKLLSDVDNLKQLGMNGYTWVMENRTYERLGSELSSRYSQILKSKITT